MEPEVKPKSIFEGFIQNITIFYLLLIFLGYISTYLYYNIFDIPIYDYFSMEDYINLFFKNLVFTLAFSFVIILSSAILIIPFLTIKKRMTGQAEKSRVSYEKLARIVVKFGSITIFLLYIWNIIDYLIDKDLRSKIRLTYLILPTILLTLISFREFVKEHKLSILSESQYIGIFFGVILVFTNYFTNFAQGARLFDQEKNKQKITFHFNNSTSIITSDSIIFVGKSTDYMFFYNKKNKEKMIYDKSLIEFIVIDGKEMVTN